ncbi:hypothetical protein [Microbacterium sp. Se63.02b]|uniref:hypothetical protein n=1 Tax=Microbacterium sp. Se63.02b TaxID=2709304 RepID=UPI001FCE639B|nr:hypothetical protein [Microbacterium sp. Se63.02b]
MLIFVAVVLLFTTRLGRGLPGLLSGQQLSDARAGGVVRVSGAEGPAAASHDA